jgi:hypothetical protein
MRAPQPVPGTGCFPPAFPIADGARLLSAPIRLHARSRTFVRARVAARAHRSKPESIMNANTLQLLLYATASALLPYIAAIALIAAGR